MYDVFVSVIESANRKCVPKKKIFTRNDKSKITVRRKWVNQETKRLHDQIEKDSDIECFSHKSLYSKFLEKLNSNRENYQKSFFESLQTVRENWNFISEVRNSKKTKTNIRTLKNSFGDIITDQKRIANLLNYHFSKLGDFFGKKGKGQPTPNFSLASKSFKFQPIEKLPSYINHLSISKKFSTLFLCFKAFFV